jgi:hypothetical protein
MRSSCKISSLGTFIFNKAIRVFFICQSITISILTIKAACFNLWSSAYTLRLATAIVVVWWAYYIGNIACSTPSCCNKHLVSTYIYSWVGAAGD